MFQIKLHILFTLLKIDFSFARLNKLKSKFQLEILHQWKG